MNKLRRKSLSDLQEAITALSADVTNYDDGADLSEAKGFAADFAVTAGDLRDEEQDYYDNMPEGLKNGEKGEAAQAAVEEIESAITALEGVEQDEDRDELVASLEEAADHLGEAQA